MSLKTLKIKRAIHKVARENNKSVRKSVRTNRQELKKIIDHLIKIIKNPKTVIKPAPVDEDFWVKSMAKAHPDWKHPSLLAVYTPDEKQNICVIKAIGDDFIWKAKESEFDIDFGEGAPRATISFDQKTLKKLYDLVVKQYQANDVKKHMSNGNSRGIALEGWLGKFVGR